ncbi:hypothetical protein NDU88_005090 [Pleurodeles waltl]|uniref:Uncharacterized protein n=1 Tax=Pleurodeles waltl TaxID=8319 RepID=A0AAV7MB39_PLEWA|nr:hypothetical protein NDU88_005090 [Pleurodeles waltl]
MANMQLCPRLLDASSAGNHQSTLTDPFCTQHAARSTQRGRSADAGRLRRVRETPPHWSPRAFHRGPGGLRGLRGPCRKAAHRAVQPAHRSHQSFAARLHVTAAVASGALHLPGLLGERLLLRGLSRTPAEVACLGVAYGGEGESSPSDCQVRRPLPSRPNLPSWRSCPRQRHGEEGRIGVQMAQYTGARLHVWGLWSARLRNLTVAAACGVLHPLGPPGGRLVPRLSRPNLPSQSSCPRPRHSKEGRIGAHPAQYSGGCSRRSGEPNAQSSERGGAAGGWRLLLVIAGCPLHWPRLGQLVKKLLKLAKRVTAV